MLGKYPTFTSFSSDDIKAAKEFYEGKLGLKVIFDMGENGARFETGKGTSFMVYLKPDHKPAKYTVLNFEVDDLEKVVDDLIAKGVNMEVYEEMEMEQDEKGISSYEGGKMAWIEDPAGNIIGLGEFSK